MQKYIDVLFSQTHKALNYFTEHILTFHFIGMSFVVSKP